MPYKVSIIFLFFFLLEFCKYLFLKIPPIVEKQVWIWLKKKKTFRENFGEGKQGKRNKSQGYVYSYPTSKESHLLKFFSLTPAWSFSFKERVWFLVENLLQCSRSWNDETEETLQGRKWQKKNRKIKSKLWDVHMLTSEKCEESKARKRHRK